MRVLVTGGSGLVGHGVRAAVESEGSTDDEFFFASSSDANLLSLEDTEWACGM